MGGSLGEHEGGSIMQISVARVRRVGSGSNYVWGVGRSRASRCSDSGREKGREKETEKVTPRRDAYKCREGEGVSLAAVSTPRHDPPPKTNEGVTAVTRSLRGVIVV